MKSFAVFQLLALFALATAKLNEKDLVQNNEIQDIVSKHAKRSAHRRTRHLQDQAALTQCVLDCTLNEGTLNKIVNLAANDPCEASKLGFALGAECAVRCLASSGFACDDQTTFCSAKAACEAADAQDLDFSDAAGVACTVNCDEIDADIAQIFGGCLSGDMLALTTNGGKMVKDLKVGDVVSVGNGQYEPIVWSTQHRDDNGKRGNEHVTATFIGFELENGQKVHLTANHFAHTTEGLILADQVAVGQTFVTNTGESTTVVAIDREVKKGAFNPQTPSQKIVVNGIVVSTRTAHSPQYMGTVFKVLAFLQSMTPSYVYNGSIEAVCKHVFEPLLFGEVSASLYFSAAATVVIAGVLRKKVAA